MKKTILILIMIVLMTTLATATITSVKYSNGDNLRGYSTSINKTANLITIKQPKMWMHYIVKTDNSPITVKLTSMSSTSYYMWNMNNPSFKYSCDGKIGLAYSKEKTAKTTTKTFSFPACNELRFYTYFAYTYNDLQVKLSEWKDKPLFNINQVLSPKGLNLTYIEIGNNNYTDKKCIVMTTRLHSTEVYSSFYMEGLIEGIDKRFTDNANLLVFPMANPDGVYYGVNHLNAMSQDLNDCWNITSCQEVNRMKEIIASFADRCGGVDMYLDWHGGNAGNPGEDATLYYTDKEREFAIDLQNRTNFKEKGRYTNTPDQSAYYMRKTYGALSFAPEIQHKYEETIHSIPVMKQQGALYAQVISDFYGFKEKSGTRPQEPLDYDMEQRYGDWYFYLKPYGWINVQPILDKTIQ